MKKLMIITFILIIACGKDSLEIDDTYMPFPETTAYWVYGCDFNCSGAGQFCWEDMIIYKQDGDTVINNVRYNKLYLKGKRARYASNGDLESVDLCAETNFNLIGGLRQNVFTKKVYFFSFKEVKEFLLYDFNLELGDNLPVTFFQEKENLIVSEVDCVLVGSKIHRIFTSKHNDYYFNEYIVIEGVGSNNDLIGSCGGFGRLRSFKNETVIKNFEDHFKALCD